MDDNIYLSIAMTESYIRYAIFDNEDNLKLKQFISTPSDSVDSILKAIYAIVDENQKNLAGIGLSVPGQVNEEHDIIYQGGSLPILHGLSLGNILSTRYEIPVAMESAGHCAVLACQYQGNLKGIDNGAVLLFGDGVTSGLVLNGKIFTGAHLHAGALGMVLSNPNVEEYVPDDVTFNSCSSTKMVNTIGRILELDDPDDTTKVFKAIENGEKNARELFNAYCRNIAYLITNTQAILDLDKYIIGGFISNQSIFVPEIIRQMQIIYNSVPVLKDVMQIPEIEASYFKQDAGLYGALFNLKNQI